MATTKPEVGSNPNSPGSVRCHLAILRDDEPDSYSVIVLNLPGAGSCGSSESEAIENTREAVQALISYYQDEKIAIPWESPDSYEIPQDAKLKWIEVDV